MPDAKTCPVCGGAFNIRQNETLRQWATREACGRTCGGRLAGQRHKARKADVMATLLEKSMPEPNSGCWIWLGAVGPHGYGTIWANGRYKRAHRLSYELHKGETIPDGLLIRHKCDNRVCVNPDHLCVGTQTQNMQDAVARERNVRGTAISQLTEDSVRLIRASSASCSALAPQFGVSRSTISNVRQRKTWAWLT